MLVFVSLDLGFLGSFVFTGEQRCGSMHIFGSTKQPGVTLSEPLGLKYPETCRIPPVGYTQRARVYRPSR